MRYSFNKLGIFLTAIGIVLVGFILIFLKYVNIFDTGQGPGSESTGSVSTSPVQRLTADLLVDFGNGRNISYTQVSLNPGETVYSLLINKMRETNSVVTSKEYDFGIMIESIDNIAATNTNFWSYFVNGQAGSIAADKYILKDKDLVEWRYIPIQ